jgi:peroxiredoxin
MRQIGEMVPDATFIGRKGDRAPEGGCPIGGEFTFQTSEDVFANKRVVVFALPGAWTPTCSSQQLPGFEFNWSRLRELGIDDVYCLSVNDGFVMNSWFEKESISLVKPLCDGSAEFTIGMGAAVSKANIGFGVRSWRYAMVVNNGAIEWLGVEPGKCDNADDDPYGESSPEKVLEFLKG